MKNETASEATPFKYLLIEEPQTDALIEEIKRILKEGESHNSESFSRARWDWQYRHLPSQSSKIYGVYLNDELYGYYHIPVYEGTVNGRLVKMGVIQDVAISQAARGKGLFRQLATFVHDELVKTGIDIIYTFPNDKSIHTFLKYNHYKQLCTLPSYIFFTNAQTAFAKKTGKKLIGTLVGGLWKMFFNSFLFSTKRKVTIETHQEITSQVANLFKENDLLYACHLNRTSAYLRWRVLEKPAGNYKVLSLAEEGMAKAAIIVKTDTITGLNAIIVMDFAYEKGGQKKLLQFLNEVSKNPVPYFGAETDLVFFCANEPVVQQLWKIGFLKVPQNFTPRPIHFLVKNINSSIDNDTLAAANWKVTLSDWDVL